MTRNPYTDSSLHLTRGDSVLPGHEREPALLPYAVCHGCHAGFPATLRPHPEPRILRSRLGAVQVLPLHDGRPRFPPALLRGIPAGLRDGLSSAAAQPVGGDLLPVLRAGLVGAAANPVVDGVPGDVVPALLRGGPVLEGAAGVRARKNAPSRTPRWRRVVSQSRTAATGSRRGSSSAESDSAQRGAPDSQSVGGTAVSAYRGRLRACLRRSGAIGADGRLCLAGGLGWYSWFKGAPGEGSYRPRPSRHPLRTKTYACTLWA